MNTRLKLSLALLLYFIGVYPVRASSEPQFAIPYFTGFDDDEDEELWTILNPMLPLLGWSIEYPRYSDNRYDGKCASFYPGGKATIPADTWFVSPAIYIEPGEYILSYMAHGYRSDVTHSYEMALGTDPLDASSFTNVITSVSGEVIFNTDEGNISNYKPFRHRFSVDAAGIYHLGIHGIGEVEFTFLRIDNIAIEVAPIEGLPIPYATDFEADDTPWTYLNNDSDAHQGWTLYQSAAEASSGEFCARFATADEYPLDAWMVSPPLDFEVGDYVLSFKIDGGSDPHTFHIAIGTDAGNDNSFSTIIKTYEEESFYGSADAPHVAQTVQFSIETPGVYYIGFNGKGCAANAILKIDELTVDKVPESKPVVTGLPLPYFTSFEPDEEQQWTYLKNDNAPLEGWSVRLGSGRIIAADGDYYGCFSTNFDYPIEAWTISPPLEFPATGKYEVSFYANGSDFYPHSFDVAVGTDPDDSESFSNIVQYENEYFKGATNSDYVHLIVPFTIEEPGVYYVGFNGHGSTSHCTLKIDAVTVRTATSSAIDAIVSDSDVFEACASQEYYDISGRRVANPVRGNIYIVRKGNTVSKHIVR